MKSTLLIIDAMNLIRRIYAVQEKQHGESPAALLATESTACNALKKLLKIHQPTHVIVFLIAMRQVGVIKFAPNINKAENRSLLF